MREYYVESQDLYLSVGLPFTLDDVQYPDNWLQLSHVSDRMELGITETARIGTPQPDDMYFNTEVWEGAVCRIESQPRPPKARNPLQELQELDTKKALTQRNLREFIMLMAQALPALGIDITQIKGIRDVIEVESQAVELRELVRAAAST